jgi:DHA1 family tetracycline resistance protein-like MFS transporter
MGRSPLRIILFIAFVDLVGFGLIIPLQAVYAERLGASGLTFGLLVGIYAVMQFLFNPILGRWSDRVGRRRVLLLSIAGSVVSHSLLGVADLAGSLPLLFLARTLDGITGANIATAQAYIADVTTAENRARGMGLFGAAFGLGFVVGPALGAGLADVGARVSGPAYGTSWPAFGAAAIAVVALVLVWRFLPEPRREQTAPKTRFQMFSLRKLRAFAGHARLRELFVLMFWATFGFVMLEVTFVYLCTHRFGIGVRGTGVLFAYLGSLMVIVQGGLVGRLVPRFGEMRLLSVGPFLTALGFLLLSGVALTADRGLAWFLLIAGCVPTALGLGLTGPNLNALISRHAQRSKQGETLGLGQGIGSLARAVGPPVGGLLYDLGPSWPYWVGAALLFGVGVFALRVRAAQEHALLRVTETEAAAAGELR